MSRKIGQIIARGERRWLVRVYLGRNRETRRRTYHNRTIYGSLRDAQACILSSGAWYEVKADFLFLVNENVTNEIKAPPVALPKWNGKENEGDYNARCGGLPSFLHFDCKDIMYGGGHSRFEFCDFMHTKAKALFFAKVASKSSGMSHLVEQVRRTAELLFNPDQAYREKLSDVFKVQHPDADRSWLKARPKNSEWKLCLVSFNRTAKDLPFLAKSALWRLYKRLTASDHEVFFVSV